MKTLRTSGVNAGWRLLAAIAFLCASCTWHDKGTIHVRSAEEGKFGIYRIENEHPLQIVLEREGRFNQDIDLQTGSYLVMADCSSLPVTVVPGAKKILTSNTVRFVPPVPAGLQDRFVIQCTQEDRAGLRQSVRDRYSLHVISSERDVLVGMKPLHLRMPGTPGTDPQLLEYRLAALRVGTQGKPSSVEEPYFVSPQSGNLSVTESQIIGRRMFLMPGKYVVELNGTRLEVDVAEDEDRLVSTGRFSVRSPAGFDVTLASRIIGSPPSLDINDGHWLGVDETYAVLPGTMELSVNGSPEKTSVVIKGDDSEVTLLARSVMVRQGCANGDALCLGSREIHLFRRGQPTPFMRGLTDAPLLFLGNDAQVALEGSKSLRSVVPDGARTFELLTGRVVVVPEPVFKPGVISEFLRVDAAQYPLVGQTMDLSFERETTLPMFAGSYELVHTLTVGASEGIRTRSSKRFDVRPGAETKLSMTVYVSEKMLRSIEERRETK